MNPLRRSRPTLALALLAVVALLYDAKIHLQLAQGYDVIGDTITQGGLFRIEAVVAILVAVALLLSDRRLVWAAAGLTGLGGLAAVLLYRYVDVGAIGPVPNMYEPVWFTEKLWSAYAQGALVLAWVAREATRSSGAPTH